MEKMSSCPQLASDILTQMDYRNELTDNDVIELIRERIKVRSRESFIPLKDRMLYAKKIFYSIRGLDLISTLLEDDEITEIMINGPDNIFVEKAGLIMPIEERFVSEEKLKNIAQQIVSDCNRVVNATSPIVDAHLPTGDRVNIVLPPVAIDGIMMTIRKFSKEGFTMDKLLSIGSVTKELSQDLKFFMDAGYNIFISGGTSSGKTTFLNALSSLIDPSERVITIEDSQELKIDQIPNLVRLEVRNANVEGENEITIRDLIKTSLRMRPDKLIVGEVRDDAAIDMLNAMNTGHSSLSTGHANSTKDMLIRLESMVLMGMDMPVVAIRQQIASGIDIMIHLGRMKDHSRKVLEVSEIVGVVNGEISLNHLYRYDNEIGLKRCGEIKKKEKLERAGLDEAYEQAHREKDI